MAVFNFTVRATDSEGSYADRQFNITVRNSRVERFMALTATDAYTSPDGLIWTLRSGSGGVTCAYGNGFWLIQQSATSMNMLKSSDGVNFSLINSSGMTFVDETGASTTAPTMANGDARCKLKFWNGRFWLLNLQASSRSLDLWSTVDGITWRRNRLYQDNAINTLSLYQGGGSAGTTFIQMYDDDDTMFIPSPLYSGTTALTPAAGYTNAMGWSTTDGSTFTPIQNSSNTTLATYRGAGWITRINGVYFAGNTAYNNVSTSYVGQVGNTSSTAYNKDYLYSTDGLNWTVSTISALSLQVAEPPIYVNGQAMFSPAVRSSSESQAFLPVYTSLDGTTWTQQQLKLDSSASSIRSRKVIFRNGVLLLLPSTTSGSDNTATLSVPTRGIRVSQDGGTTWSIVNENGPGTYNDIAAM